MSYVNFRHNDNLESNHNRITLNGNSAKVEHKAVEELVMARASITTISSSFII